MAFQAVVQMGVEMIGWSDVSHLTSQGPVVSMENSALEPLDWLRVRLQPPNVLIRRFRACNSTDS